MSANSKASTHSRRSVLKVIAAAPALSPLFLRYALAAEGTYDYYVSPTGSLSNSGTIDSPWSVDALAVKTQIAGKRVGLLDGHYSVPSTYGDNWGGTPKRHGIRLSQAGTSDSPTVIEAINFGAVTFAPASGVDFSLVTIAAPYVQVRGIVFDARSFGPVRIWSDYCTIESCEFLPISVDSGGDNFGAIGFKLKGEVPVKRPVIRNCAFRGVYNSGSTYTVNANAIMGYCVSDALIEYCTASNCFSLFRPKYDWFGYTVRYNHFNNVSCFLQHLCVPAGYTGRVQIHNNLAFASSGAYMYESTEKAGDADIYNNTVVVSASSGSCARWWKRPGETRNTNRFFNNVFAVRSSPSGSFRTHSFGGLTGSGYRDLFDHMDYNAYPASVFSACDGDIYNPTASWSSMSAWRGASGFDTHSIQADPGFVNAAGTSPSDFKLIDTSVCRNAGRAGGLEGGALVDQGCWSTGVAYIGATLSRRAPLSTVAPVLRVD